MQNKYIMFFIVMTILLAPYLFFRINRHIEVSENAKKQIGCYRIDINKTKLGLYVKDSTLYSELTVEFKEDRTFLFNFKVPFVYDSIGTWVSSTNEPEDWSTLTYDNKNNNQLISDQFNGCCSNDSAFYINSTTPESGKDGIPRVFFKKINCTAQ
jgi:hypothetical protein